MDMCEMMAQRSTCCKLRTAALVVSQDNRILSVGYNGTCKGEEHCVDYWKKRTGFTDPKDIEGFESFLETKYFKREHHEWSKLNEIHGEQNAILYASRRSGLSTKGTTVYTLYSPCINCAKVMSQAGVNRVVYRYVYHGDMSGIDFLKRLNVKVGHYPPSSTSDDSEAKQPLPHSREEEPGPALPIPLEEFDQDAHGSGLTVWEETRYFDLVPGTFHLSPPPPPPPGTPPLRSPSCSPEPLPFRRTEATE